MADQTLSSNLIKGIVSTEKAKKEQTPILDANFKNDDSELLKKIITEDETKKGKAGGESSLLIRTLPKKNPLLIILKVLFVLLCVATVASVLFFTSQLTNTFDFVSEATGKGIPNLSQDISKQNENLVAKQTELNFYRFLEAKMYMDQVSYYGDSFMKNFEIFNSKTASSSERKKARDDMAIQKEKISVAFTAAAQKLSSPIYQDLVSLDYKSMDPATKQQELTALFTNELANKFNSAIADLEKSDTAQDKVDYKNYNYALLLLNNQPLQALIVGTNFADISKDDQKVYDLIKQINTITVNDFSAIQRIKEGRIKWSEVIDEIDRRTSQIDQYYSKDFYDEYGGIRYTSYDFDSSTGKISISGETKRYDAKNFTTIASLIDELNNSDLFTSAEMRSFTKSGTIEDGYTASIQIVTYLKEALAKIQAAQPVEGTEGDVPVE